MPVHRPPWTRVARIVLLTTELFLAAERLTDRPLPQDLLGTLEIAPLNAPVGFRPVCLFGRQRDDSKVWTSAQFIRFESSRPPAH